MQTLQDNLSNPRYQVVLIERPEKIKTEERFKFDYMLSKDFLREYEQFYTIVSDFKMELDILINEFLKKKVNNKEHRQIALNDFLGYQILNLMKKHSKKFVDFRDSHTNAVKDIYDAVINIDCDIKDMTHFFGLLPRFQVVYKRISQQLHRRKDPVILYYRDLLVDIHTSFLYEANQILGFVRKFHLWIDILQGMYQIPVAFKDEDFLKVSMIERVAILFSDSLRDVSIVRTQIRHSMTRFREMYSQIEEFFVGLEEHTRLAIPLDFPSLGNGGKISGSIWCGLILLFGLLLKSE